MQKFPKQQGRKQGIKCIGYSVIWKEPMCFNPLQQQMANFLQLMYLLESSVSEILKQQNKGRQHCRNEYGATIILEIAGFFLMQVPYFAVRSGQFNTKKLLEVQKMNGQRQLSGNSSPMIKALHVLKGLQFFSSPEEFVIRPRTAGLQRFIQTLGPTAEKVGRAWSCKMNRT